MTDAQLADLIRAKFEAERQLSELHTQIRAATDRISSIEAQIRFAMVQERRGRPHD